MDTKHINELMNRLKCIQLQQAHAPKPDALSISLLELEQKMNALDADGIAALIDELSGDDMNMTPEQVQEFIYSFRRRR